MFVEIINNVEQARFNAFGGGDVIVHNNTPYLVLKNEFTVPEIRGKANAVSLETGELAYFEPCTQVIEPDVYSMTIEL